MGSWKGKTVSGMWISGMRISGIRLGLLLSLSSAVTGALAGKGLTLNVSVAVLFSYPIADAFTST